MQPKPNLDLMRAVAISLVVLDHLLMSLGVGPVGPTFLHWSPGWMGVFGVYLFFVHTSLVLMWSLQRRPHTLDFYIRRAFRIYPLAIAVILTAVLCRLPVSEGPGPSLQPYQATAVGLLTNLLLIQNIGRGGGYVLGVLWSLPLEVEMYVLLPVLYFFVRKNFSLWPLLLIWLMSCGLAYHAAMLGNTFATVVPCFLPGIMAYVLFARTTPRLPAWLFPCFLAMLCIGFLHFSSTRASWPACLVLALCLPHFHQVSFAPLVRLAHELATYSYGIYLTHFFGIAIAFRLLPLHTHAAQATVMLLCTAVFSIAGYHLIEHPLIRLGARLAASAERRQEGNSARSSVQDESPA